MRRLSRLFSLCILLIMSSGCFEQNSVKEELQLSNTVSEIKGGIPGKGKNNKAICQEGTSQSIDCSLANASSANQDQICQNGAWVDSGSCYAVSCMPGFELQAGSCVEITAIPTPTTEIVSETAIPFTADFTSNVDGWLSKDSKIESRYNSMRVELLSSAPGGSYRDFITEAGKTYIIKAVGSTEIADKLWYEVYNGRSFTEKIASSNEILNSDPASSSFDDVSFTALSNSTRIYLIASGIAGAPGYFNSFSIAEELAPAPTTEPAPTTGPTTDITPTYYIDSLNGSDANAGTSSDQAWKTIAKVNSMQLQAGDVVAFKRGQTFSGRLILNGLQGSSQNNIIFTAYGAGDNPVIENLNHAKWNDWVQVATNIYKRSMSHPIRLAQDGQELLYAHQIDTSTFTRKAGVADPLNSQFRWHHDGSSSLYLYSASNPNNSTFTYSNNARGISLENSSYITIRDLTIKGGNAAIYATNSSHIEVANCIAGEYAVYAIRVTNSSSYFNIHHNNFDTKYTLNYWNGETYRGSSVKGHADAIQIEGLKDSKIHHNFVKNWAHSSIQLIDYSKGSGVERNEIYNNTFTSPDLAYGGRIAVDYANFNEFHHNDIVDTSVQTQLNGHDNYYHHNYFENTKDTPLKNGNQGHCSTFYAYGSLSVYNNRLEYNTFHNCDGSGVALIATGSTSKFVYDQQINNNIFYNTGHLPHYNSGALKDIAIHIENQFGDVKGQTFMNNAFYHPTELGMVGYGTSRLSVDQFNNKNGVDGNTVSGNVFLSPDESSTTYGAGPRQYVGAGAP